MTLSDFMNSARLIFCFNRSVYSSAKAHLWRKISALKFPISFFRVFTACMYKHATEENITPVRIKSLTRQLFFTGARKSSSLLAAWVTLLWQVRSVDAATIFFGQIASNAPWASTSPVSHPENGTTERENVCAYMWSEGRVRCLLFWRTGADTRYFYLFAFFLWVGGGGGRRRQRVCCELARPLGFYGLCNLRAASDRLVAYLLCFTSEFVPTATLLFNSAPPLARKEALRRCRRRFGYFCPDEGRISLFGEMGFAYFKSCPIERPAPRYLRVLLKQDDNNLFCCAPSKQIPNLERKTLCNNKP